MKRCFKCGATKPLDEFYRHGGMADGHLGKCKVCTRKDVHENYVKRRPYYSAYEAERSQWPERKLAKHASEKLHRLAHPDRYRARLVVSKAIQRGALTRQPCQECGHEKSQAHHDDHSKPLDIKWLCFKCHRESHGQVVTSDWR